MTPTTAMRRAMDALTQGDLASARRMLEEAMAEEEREDEPLDTRGRLLVPSAQARTRLPELLARVADGDRVIILKRGRPVAALVSVEDADQVADFEDALDHADAEAAKAEGGPNIPLDQIRRELGLE